MILIRTKIYEERPLDVARDAWRNIMREAHADQGEHWHRTMLPDHFNERAKFRYHHQARTKGYKQSKKRAAQRGGDKRGPVLMGGVVDNVRSGVLMRALTNVASIRAFPTRVTVTMYGPRYISMKPNRFNGGRNGKGSNQPDKAKEILTTTLDQQQELAKVLDDSVTRRLNQYRAPRTITI